MKKVIKICLILLIIMTAQITHGQANKEAVDKAREAIRLMDTGGKYDDAIKLLAEAQKLEPESMIYPYEMAYAYTGIHMYKKASDILETLLTHKDVNEQVYQALGNNYDYQEMPAKAIETYKAGLKKFPNSAKLFLELGNMQSMQKEYNAALTYYENGIDVDPAFPSNYYWASKIYCSSDEKVWGLIYGEIFMNLERNSDRTAEISKLLFDTYKSGIRFTSDTSLSVSLSKTSVIKVSDLKIPKKFKLPFGTGAFEMTLSIATIGEEKIDIASLDRIRTRFVEIYFNGDNAKDYPNILFDYQRKIMKEGHLGAYNYWILMKGDEDEFQKWGLENKEQWENFVAWFLDNPLKLDKEHKFIRWQY